MVKKGTFGMHYLQSLIGPDGLDALVANYGGLTLRVPRRAAGASWLGLLSDAAAARLVQACAGCEVYIPKRAATARARRNAEIIAAFSAGVGARELARRYNLSERWIWELLGRPEEAS